MQVVSEEVLRQILYHIVGGNQIQNQPRSECTKACCEPSRRFRPRPLSHLQLGSVLLPRGPLSCPIVISFSLPFFSKVPYLLAFICFYQPSLQSHCFTLRVSHTVKHAIRASFSWAAVSRYVDTTQEGASYCPSHRHSRANYSYSSHYWRDLCFNFYSLVCSLRTGRLSPF